MARLALPDIASAPPRSRPPLEFIRSSMGWLPNFFRLCSNSPEALSGYALLDSALANALDYDTRTRISIAVSEVNGSGYCLAAHGFHAAAVTGSERPDTAPDGRSLAAVAFARTVAERRGHVADEDLALARQAGLRDAQIVEIVAVVAATCFTNFLNSVAETEVDYPSPREIN